MKVDNSQGKLTDVTAQTDSLVLRRTVLLVWLQRQFGYPHNSLFLLSKKLFLRSKYPKQI